MYSRAGQSAIYCAKRNFRNCKSCHALYCVSKLDCGSCVA